MNIDMSFLPDGKSGDWEIDTITVEKDELSQKLSIIKTGRGVPKVNINDYNGTER